MRTKTFTTLSATVLALSLGLASCGGGQSTQQSSNDDLSGTISLSGAFALYPLAQQWAEAFKQQHPNVRIDISAGGAGKGMTDALGGMVDLGMLSRDVDEAEQQKGAYPLAVAKDAVVPVISVTNPNYDKLVATGIKKSVGIEIWINESVKTWGDFLGDQSVKDELHTYTRSDACGAAETFAKWLGKKQENLKGTAVYGDPGVVKALQDDKLGIGMVNIAFAYDTKTLKPVEGTTPIPIDVNENGKIDEDENFYADKKQLCQAIADGKYPSPPARKLYLVSKGKPSGVTKAFIDFILSKEGQAINETIGYISLTEAEYTEEANKTK